MFTNITQFKKWEEITDKLSQINEGLIMTHDINQSINIKKYLTQ